MSDAALPMPEVEALVERSHALGSDPRTREDARARCAADGNSAASRSGGAGNGTRSRAWKKNDSAHVEQKNGAVVRHLVGYDRFAARAAYAQLARVYQLARLHVNFFQPVEKLVRKTRHGARVHRVYDRAQTPYQRLCAAGVLAHAKRQELAALYQSLNPLTLQRDLEAALEHLWSLAAPDPLRPHGDTEVATASLKSSPGGSSRRWAW